MKSNNMQVEKILQSSYSVIKDLTENKVIIDIIDKVSKKIIECFKNGNKVLLCGNGGSAADAQHIAAELSGRFYLDRAPLPAEALHVNTSYITAVANDYSYDEIYSRYINGMGHAGDILVGLSTSGNSKNIINAFIAAKGKNMETIALTGKSGGLLKEHALYLINIPSSDTPRIQEAHILVGHIICEIVEKELFG
jgi:D-sedoheptulose 7-phosphate isomerase